MSGPERRIKHILDGIDSALHTSDKLVAPQLGIDLEDEGVKFTDSEPIGQPVIAFTDIREDPLTKKARLVCRLGDKITTPGTTITVGDYFLPDIVGETVKPVQDGQIVHYRRDEFLHGPLILIRYDMSPMNPKRRGKNARASSSDRLDVIELDTGDYVFGNKSVARRSITATRMNPKILEQLPITIGESFYYEDGGSPVTITVPFPVVEILICSPILSFPPEGHPFWEKVMEGGEKSIDNSYREFFSKLFIDNQKTEQSQRRTQFLQRTNKARRELLKSLRT